MIKLKSAEFTKLVLESATPCVVDFNAAWCGPCKKLAPILTELSKEYQDKVFFGEVDAGEEPGISQQYGVMSLPTILFFKKGQIADKLVGLAGKEKIIEKINAMLK